MHISNQEKLKQKVMFYSILCQTAINPCIEAPGFYQQHK